MLCRNCGRAIEKALVGYAHSTDVEGNVRYRCDLQEYRTGIDNGLEAEPLTDNDILKLIKLYEPNPEANEAR